MPFWPAKSTSPCTYIHTYICSYCRYGDLVNSFPTQFIAGGAAQNSIRGAQVRVPFVFSLAQWMLPPMATSYFGCVGKDAYALKMREAAAKDGVRALYQEEQEHPTGTCAVLVTGNHR
jgi:adenosine kinase